MQRSSRAILHIDGDAFFASCEQSRDPALRGKPVITGKERGIVSSMSYEAKARGVTRAMRLFEVKKLCPDAVILPSDYETYSMLSRRFYAIVRRYTDTVEEYSIDECFADITDFSRLHGKDFEDIARDIQGDLVRELGFTFSIGLAPNKVLAKVGSKWNKPHGLAIIGHETREQFLYELPVGKIWGIGPRTTLRLREYGIITALHFAQQPKEWVENYLAKPFYEIWQELNGVFLLPLTTQEKESYASIQKVKTFTPPSRDKSFIFSQLSKNIENACIKARRYGLTTQDAFIFLRTQDFHDTYVPLKLPHPSAFPHEIIEEAKAVFHKIFDSFTEYRSTGIMLCNLTPNALRQTDLFGEHTRRDRYQRLYDSIDTLSQRHGKYTVYLGSSFKAQNFARHEGDRGDAPMRMKDLFRGETARKRIGIPMFLGALR